MGSSPARAGLTAAPNILMFATASSSAMKLNGNTCLNILALCVSEALGSESNEG